MCFSELKNKDKAPQPPVPVLSAVALPLTHRRLRARAEGVPAARHVPGRPQSDGGCNSGARASAEPPAESPAREAGAAIPVATLRTGRLPQDSPLSASMGRTDPGKQ